MRDPQAADLDHTHPQGKHCRDVPPIDRLAYFYGQMLTPEHMQRAQASIYDRANLHNRCLHGWGVVCGLGVKPCPRPARECPPDDQGEHDRPAEAKEEAAAELASAHGEPYRTRLEVDCGLALDCAGRELVVRAPLRVDVLGTLSREDRLKLESNVGPATLYLSLCYRMFGIEPTRQVVVDGCSLPQDRNFGYHRDGVCVRITLEPPPQDDPCESCCTPCPAECVLLARIDEFIPGKPLSPSQIHNSVRRPLSPYVPTVITGVGWQHGASYRPEDVDRLLWTKGLTVRFSRPILAETLQRGVFDVFVIELGHGRSGLMRLLKGDFIPPAQERVSEFRYVLSDKERVDPGDRIMLALRTDFLLDGCCRPVDGNHEGGRVPLLDIKDLPQPVQVPPRTVCKASWRRFGPWTSGNGSPGGAFESWFFVQDNAEKKEKAR